MKKKRHITKKKKGWLSLLFVLTLSVGITFLFLGYKPSNLLTKSSSNTQSIAAMTTSVNSITLTRGSCPVSLGNSIGTYSSANINCNDGYSTAYTPGCQTAQQLATYAEGVCANRAIPTPSRLPSPTTSAATVCPDFPGNGTQNTCINGSSCPAGYSVYGNATNNACGRGMVCCNRMPTPTPMRITPTPMRITPTRMPTTSCPQSGSNYTTYCAGNTIRAKSSNGSCGTSDVLITACAGRCYSTSPTRARCF